MTLDPNDLVDQVLLMTGKWEQDSWQSIERHLPPGGTFIDVGAHVGYYSIKAARRVGSTGTVVAIEPNPETLVRLRKNLDLNGLSRMVSVQPVACFEERSQVTLYLSPRVNTGETSLSKENASFSGDARSVVVDALPLDEILGGLEISRVDVIKMDIEGAELTALRGAMKTLRTYRPVLILEVVDHHLRNMGTSEMELRTFLDQAGYSAESSLHLNMAWVPKEMLVR